MSEHRKAIFVAIGSAVLFALAILSPAWTGIPEMSAADWRAWTQARCLHAGLATGLGFLVWIPAMPSVRSRIRLLGLGLAVGLIAAWFPAGRQLFAGVESVHGSIRSLETRIVSRPTVSGRYATRPSQRSLRIDLGIVTEGGGRRTYSSLRSRYPEELAAMWRKCEQAGEEIRFDWLEHLRLVLEEESMDAP